MSAPASASGRAATRAFLQALYRSAPPASLVEIRSRAASRMNVRFHPACAIERVVDAVASLASWTEVYVGVLPRRRRGGGRHDLLARAGVVWVDCDGPKSVASLEAFRPRPAILVASGSARNRHAYWLLDEPAALEAIERMNRALALTLRADPRSSDLPRILRPPGSVNRKHSPPAPVQLLRVEEWRVRLEELERRLPGEGRNLSARARPVPRGAPADPLLALAPTVYVERLTDLRVGRSRKLPCPFHDDRTPSLHVYEEPERGWYCFGCGRGGTIYDFAGHLWSSRHRRDTRAPVFLRGLEFHSLRERLLAMFLDDDPQV